jgi:hypothetical protein
MREYRRKIKKIRSIRRRGGMVLKYRYDLTNLKKIKEKI